jgi:hypothetical protein
MEQKTVIGGGLAGLASAICLAQRGFPVRLLEQSSHLGGRAITTVNKEFSLNLGPHALYRSGHAYRMLSEWGIAPSGTRPAPGSRANLVYEGRLVDFPQSATGLMFSSILSVGEKLDAATTLRKLQSRQGFEGSMHDWIRREVSTEKVALFVQAMVRLSTYNNELDLLSASCAIRQFQAATTGGVMYLDNGWQSMVDAMRDYAVRMGVQIETGSSETGSILAVPPAQVEKLTGAKLPTLRPVRMACLDLGLSSLPAGASLFALGLDTPFYHSVHSQWAKVAPEGQAVVHIGRYLGSGCADRAELEAFADITMPGWRDRVIVDRFLPDMTVAHSAPWIDAPRPSFDTIPGVRLAGDWVGEEAMLADASFASAARAAA